MLFKVHGIKYSYKFQLRRLMRTGKKTWEDEITFNHGTSNSTGVAILFKSNEIKLINQVHIAPGRATLVDVESGGEVFGLINVYCPNNDDTDFLNNVFLEACSKTKSENLVFSGDRNTVLNNPVDKAGGAESHIKNVKFNCQSLLNNILTDWGFCDVFRINNPDARVYTHFDKQHKTHSRLDFFLVDDRLVNLPVCRSNISHGVCYDHSYVTLTLQGNPLIHGRCYWKFNDTHLSSEKFTQEVRTIICDILSYSYDSFSGVWDTIKFRIKDYAIYFGKKTKKCKMVEKKRLTEMIESIRKEGTFINNPTDTEELLQLEARLENIIKEEMDGVIVRSKAQFVEKGGRLISWWTRKVGNPFLLRTRSLSTLSSSTRSSTPWLIRIVRQQIVT